ncbi:zinc metallopeptidase [Parablautia intestinalis]|uniref:Zinc metallopeptidase n=1 Tax=Parablautia intestinalis TaxID=2320100 RepID=A0A3A9AEQ0_9FIRM|nr:zinc metallopeptidase [Parablautia intestinalis]MDE7048073.1 zinc metallopeptidase [Lachnospiraceae bacterium]RKI90140.1 zinc metallopeptidase [Parablautia intestinalis]
MFFDPTYILVIIGAVLCIAASSRVNSTYRKYSKVRSRSGMTGAEAARRILQLSGINDVQIQHIAGDLTDHYDPTHKVLRLSDSVYGSRSVAAIGVAAHECGHALQHKEGYAPLKIRAMLVPAANIGSKLGLPLVILGIILGIGFRLPGGGYFSLAQIGVWVFFFAVLFQIVTLPVEFNASGRALKMLGNYGMLGNDEVNDCRRVLGAAALTYVAAAASSLLQLLRLLYLSNSRRRD